MRLLLLPLLLPLFLHVAPAAPAQRPPPPEIAARSYLLVDFHSGQVLAEREADVRVEPASLTKLMTAYLAFQALQAQHIRLDQSVTVSERAWRVEGSRMFLEPRKPVMVEALVRGLIVQSANDACIALAEAIAGSEEAFVERMNREARRLGLGNTRYVNATGLPHPGHYSTARDLGTLAAAVIRDFPQFYRYYSEKTFRHNDITQSSANRLLWLDPAVDGMGTGYTEKAGYGLVGSARRGERRLLSVVLGAASEAARAAESQKLLNHGFQAWDGMRLYAARQAVATLKVYKGEADAVPAGLAAPLHVAVPRGAGASLRATMESMQPLLAPIGAGQRVGTMKITMDGKPLREVPVVALESVAAAGLFGRGWDALRLLFR